MNPLDDARDPMTLGLPVLGYQVRGVDEATGADVGPGGQGQLLVAGVPGRTLMRGYFKDPAATARDAAGRLALTPAMSCASATTGQFYVRRPRQGPDQAVGRQHRRQRDRGGAQGTPGRLRCRRRRHPRPDPRRGHRRLRHRPRRCDRHADDLTRLVRVAAGRLQAARADRSSWPSSRAPPSARSRSTSCASRRSASAALHEPAARRRDERAAELGRSGGTRDVAPASGRCGRAPEQAGLVRFLGPVPPRTDGRATRRSRTVQTSSDQRRDG